MGSRRASQAVELSLDQRKCPVMLGTALVEQFSHMAPFQTSEATWGSWHVGSDYSSLAISLAATSIWEDFHRNQGTEKAPRSASRRVLASKLRRAWGCSVTCGPSRST